jgi:2-dehydro-3-deoxyphosphogluconate aldolase/(4S)-4-hydroxy-2-oxoglutarate aldolase
MDGGMMNKADVMQWIRTLGVIPVVRAASADEAMRAVEAIKEGGVSILEITLTVPGALGIIETLSARYGRDVLVGAGTVLDAVTARHAILSGAQFVVSPALDLEMITCCRTYAIAVMAGALTPSEVLQAWKGGADFVKVFPASAMGGAAYIKSLKAPLPQIEMVPTGGVSLKTAADFIRAGASALGVGADLVNTDALRNGQASRISEAARQFLDIVKQAREAK